MTSQSVVIAGYKLTVTDFNKCKNINDLISILDEFKIKSNLSNLIFVNRNYDSIDLDDYGIYISFNYYILPRQGTLDNKEITNVITFGI
ncbi:putative ORFan [Tupanvirus deep ocean]|uniref:ORFan n=1 Tax=Tupanvirus soda lake TaxID=2126985 RepID=A0A2K9L132_9VIRU|nr:putative ORFan [Tupanvirus deep ocean]AUL79483.2 putative ORFan [Tupanvirus deep ocean]